MSKRYRIVVLLLLSIPLVAGTASAAGIKTGAEVLRDSGFTRLQKVRYGLVTNQTATVGNNHLLDLLIAAGVPPTVIFVPEHGLKGTREDGVRIDDSLERGIPVRSLYGGVKKPRPQDLAGLGLLLFDIQDIGARFYTYISTMGLVMQSAAEAGLPLLILDRPNPLGGDYVAGFVSQAASASFTSLYPVPVAHGMTVGELAQMIKGENLLPGLNKLELDVLKMSGWERWMRWPDTGLAWTATSPNIPDFDAALLYAGICLLEGTSASEGRGTDSPFQLAGWPGIDSDRLAQVLNGAQLPGVAFRAAQFTPKSIPGRSTAPKYRGRTISGVNITVTDYGALLPVETGVAVLGALYRFLPAKERHKFFHRGINDLSGSPLFRRAVEDGASPAGIAALWSDEVAQFRLRRAPYLLYPAGRSPVPGRKQNGATARLNAAP
jgi:uncharacterized protein YbbC (DUF1343 family)